MAFDLVQYFSEQIKFQNHSFLASILPKEKQSYIHEINVLTLGQLISLWRQDPKTLSWNQGCRPALYSGNCPTPHYLQT